MERVLGMRLEQRPASVGSFASNLRGFEQVRDFIASSTVTALIDLPFALLFVARDGLDLALAAAAGAGLPSADRGWVGHPAAPLHELSETTYRAGASATPR
jgi:ATP-binding cassette subfamily C protein LapB